MTRLYLHGVGSCALGADEPFAAGPGQLAELPIKQYAKPAKLRRYARVARLVYVAASRAIQSAGVDDPSTLAVVTATAMGELGSSLKLLEQIRDKRGQGISPALVPNTVHNAPAGHLTIGIGTRFPAVTVSQGWLSAEAALVAAADLLGLGDVRRVLVAVGDESDPAWIDRLGQAGAEQWARALGAEAFQEGAVALVVGRQPGGAGLGWIEARVERVGDRVEWLRQELGRLGPLAPAAEVRLRHGAGGAELLAALTDGGLDAPIPKLDGPGPGSSQAGALGVLADRIRDPGCEDLVLVGAELDEVGVMRWQR